MNAMPNSGVARFRIGIDTNAAMKAPASTTVPWWRVRSASPPRPSESASRRAGNIRARAGSVFATKKIRKPNPANSRNGTAIR
jgi:hypothetical protein